MESNNEEYEYYCTVCRQDVDENDKFCRNCGAEISKIVNEDDEQTIDRCEACGTENPSNYKFCKNCGSKIIRKKICSNCNVSFKVDGNFCPNCGKPFNM